MVLWNRIARVGRGGRARLVEAPVSRPYKPRVLQTTKSLANLLGTSENAVRELYRRGRLKDEDPESWEALLSVVQYGLEKNLITEEHVRGELPFEFRSHLEYWVNLRNAVLAYIEQNGRVEHQHIRAHCELHEAGEVDDAITELLSDELIEEVPAREEAGTYATRRYRIKGPT